MPEPAAPWSQIPVFDRAAYDRINDETDGAGPEIVAVYCRVAPVRKAAMLRAVASGERDELARLAHAAKSGSRTIGLLRLAELCVMIERGLASQTLDMAAVGGALTNEFDAAIVILDQLRQE